MGLIFEVAEGGALDIDVNIEGKDHPDSWLWITNFCSTEKLKVMTLKLSPSGYKLASV